MSVSFLVSLVDNVSGPAQSMSKALGSAGDAFEGLKKTVEGIVSENPEQTFQGIEEAVKAAGLALLEATEAALQFGVQMSDARNAGILSMEKLLGGADQASAAYDQIAVLAEQLGTSRDDALRQFKQLTLAGLGQDQATKAIEAVADLQKATGSGEALQRILKTIQAKGTLDARAITQLARGVGVPLDTIYKSIAQATGKSIEQVKVALKTGAIDAATALPAILGVVNAKVGGTAKAVASGTITGVIEQIKSAFGRIFSGIDLSPVLRFLQSIYAALSGPAGQRLGQSVSKLLNAIVGAFGQLTQGANPTSIVDGIAKAVGVLGKVVAAVLPPVVTAIRFVGSVVAWLASHWKILAIVTAPIWLPIVVGAAAAAAVMAMLAAPIVAVIAAVSWLGDAFDGVGDKIESALSSAWSAVTSFVGQMVDAGGALIDGLVQGIEDNAGKIIDAVVSACGGAIKAAISTLKIGSPSKVFAEIGGHTASGFAQGIDDHPGPQAAIQRMVDPRAAGAAAGKAAATRGGGIGHKGDVNITVHVGGTNAKPEEIAAAMGKELRRVRAEMGVVL